VGESGVIRVGESGVTRVGASGVTSRYACGQGGRKAQAGDGTLGFACETSEGMPTGLEPDIHRLDIPEGYLSCITGRWNCLDASGCGCPLYSDDFPSCFGHGHDVVHDSVIDIDYSRDLSCDYLSDIDFRHDLGSVNFSDDDSKLESDTDTLSGNDYWQDVCF
jgi:hypothetical protein